MEKIIYAGDDRTFDKVCSHCRMCELICSFTRFGQVNPKRSKIKIVRTQLDDALPVTCLQCEDAPCARVCPVQAITQCADQYLAVDPDQCIGCGICVVACPVGAIFIDRGTGRALKCDLCQGDPQCVQYCPPRVLKKGKTSDLASLRSRQFVRILLEASREGKGKS